MKIISLFTADYTLRFYLREISRIANIPLKTCQNVLSYLEKSRIIKTKTEGKNKYFFLNLNNIETKLYLLNAEIYKTRVFIDRYPWIKLFLKEINSEGLIAVFGSFAKFSAKKDSDIDILIVSKAKPGLPFHLLPFKPHEIVLSKKTFIKSLINSESIIKEIEKNHILLNNHCLYVDIMWGYYAKQNKMVL